MTTPSREELLALADLSQPTNEIEPGPGWARKSNFFVGLLKFALLAAVIRMVLLWVGGENILALGLAGTILFLISWGRTT